MNPQAANTLKQLIRQHGTGLVNEPRRVRALLLDFCAQHKREVRILSAVAEEGVAAVLLRDGGKIPLSILLSRSIKKLHDELGFDQALAEWAIATWAEALGFDIPSSATPKQAPPANAHIAPITQQGSNRPIIPASRASQNRILLTADDWVWLEGGEFLMGSPEDEEGRFEDERQHWVRVDSFGLMKTAVTWGMYKRYCAATSAALPERPRFSYDDNHPVVNVDWYNALAYAEWLSRESGWRCRLPTEAEWEYACRAGTETRYWWGNAIGRNQANCKGCGSRWDNKRTAPVKSFPPNPWGLYEMHGNVEEWTASAFDESYQGGESQLVSKCHAGSLSSRGGGWYLAPQWARSACRGGGTASCRHATLGFRLAQD